MRQHDLDALEFPALLERLSGFARSPAGVRACRALRPSTEPSEVERRLEETEECLRLLEREGTLPPTDVPDLESVLARASHGGFVLDGRSLVDVRKLLEITARLRSFLRARAPRDGVLVHRADRLHPLPELREVLERSLDEEGAVRDEASEELANIRSSLRSLRDEITRRLERLVHRASLSDVIAEPYVTIRNNRFVVPVRPHYAQKLQGIVQDRSASGETLFLEPLFAVELNNALLMGVREEERVVRKILADLSDLVRSRLPEIRESFEAAVEFDVLVARARFAERHRCTRPKLGASLSLRGARHPLLEDSRPVVPVDLLLPEGKRALVLTGPNTGGKTAALKTAGLASLMAQTGLLVPAEPGSEVPVWRGIFVDIGDEQSLERDLSTFSAHVANLRGIFDDLEPPALVLLDEPGVGTDPEEGAKLATALLETLVGRGACVLATTHHREVKVRALAREDWSVAAVEFDPRALVPRYRLVYGSPGESFGLLVAEKLGLPSEVVEAARRTSSGSEREVDAARARLEEFRRGYEARAADLRAREASLAEREEFLRRREAELADLLGELEKRKREVRQEERHRLAEFLGQLRAEARGLLEKIRTGEAGRAELERFVEKSRARIRRETEHEEARGPLPRPRLEKGMTVELLDGGFRGELVSVAGEKAWVRRGAMRIEVPLSRLRPSSGERKAPEAPVRTPPPDAPTEIMLVGLRAREAIERLETFLDRAALAGHDSVRVVHGVGSGALRRAIHAYLEASPYCGRYRPADASEGGPGVTVVEIGPVPPR